MGSSAMQYNIAISPQAPRAQRAQTAQTKAASAMQLAHFMAGLLAGLAAMLGQDAAQARFVAALAACIAGAIALHRSQKREAAMLQQEAAQTAAQAAVAQSAPTVLAEMLQQAKAQSKQLQAVGAALSKLQNTLQHIEWRSMLVAEAKWSNEGLAATYRRWQTGCLRMPPMPSMQSTSLDCGALMGPADEAAARSEVPEAVIARDTWQWGQSLAAEHALEEMEAAAPALEQSWEEKRRALQAWEDAVASGGQQQPQMWSLQAEGCALHRVETYCGMRQPPKQPAKQKKGGPADADAAGSAACAAPSQPEQ